MQNILIRRPRKEDINLINEFFEIVLNDTFEKNDITDLVEDYEHEIIEKREFLNHDLESNGQKRYFLVATIDDKVIGTIAYGPANNLINECTKGELKDLIEIGTVFVHPEYQGKGIGNLMLTHIYAELNKKGINEFCLDSGYKNAQKIWSKKFGDPQYNFVNHWGEGTNYMIWRSRIEDV